MHAEDLLVNKGGNRKAVETVSEGLPESDVVSSLAFVVESIDTIDGGALVVTSEQEEVLWILDLVGEEKADGFETLFTSINIITEEQVIGLWRETAILEQSQEIVVLTVNIT